MPAVNTVRIRQGTSTQWASTNPVLASGEPGFDTTNRLLKIGDGVSTWTALNNTASYSLLDVDNIRLDANTISSTDANGHINIVPNIAGDVILDTDTTRIGDSADIGSTSTANLLLLRFDGNLTDSSIYGRTATAAGNATTSTAQRKFGTHSAIFDGSGDRVDIPSSADFNLGATDHTVDFWMWINSSVNAVNERLVVFEGTTQTRGIVIDNADKTKIGVNLFGTGYQILSATAAISNQTWIHVALVRSGTTTTLYVNGTSVGSTTSQCLPTTNSSVSIGGNIVRFVDNNYNGYIDELRIVNSAVWTSNFTPPTSQYSQYINPNAVLTSNGTLNLVLNTNSGTNSGSITIAQGTNANITVSPNGTGDVNLDADTVRVGDANVAATITTNGTGNLVLNTNAGTNSGSITISQGANGYVTMSPNGSGIVTCGASDLHAYTLVSTLSSGDEGGEIRLNKPVTNTALTVGVTVDVYQNRFRIYETGGSNRGYYLDITSGGNTVGTRLLAESSPTIVGSLTLGNGGIIFPAAATISSSANTLDDYEEGTFTPSYTASTTNFTSVTYQANLRVGNYVKIGRLVSISIRIATSARSGGTGNVLISGLPFTVSGGNQANFMTAVASFKSGWVNNGPDGGYCDVSTTNIILTLDNNTAHATIPVANLPTGTSTDLMISLIYETDQ